MIGKIQLELTPVVSHFWNVTLRVTARGLATPALRVHDQTFDIELDFIEHLVIVRTNDRRTATMPLRPLAVADFQSELFGLLDSLDLHVHIWERPVELKSDPIAFSEDRIHAAYDREYVERFFRILSNVNELLEQFRARFIGKCSGVGFYWGTFDLSVSRYSGRQAPEPPTTSSIEREGFSHEVSEVGFWPGDALYRAPAFYALHFPAPEGYASAIVRPDEAHWEQASNCFVLSYEECRERSLAAKALEFFQSTYEAGASLASWNRRELERTTETRGQHAA